MSAEVLQVDLETIVKLIPYLVFIAPFYTLLTSIKHLQLY